MGEMSLSSHEIEKEKEIHASLDVASQTAKVMATVRDKRLVKKDKALNLWTEDGNRNHVLTDGNMHQKALGLYKDFSKGPLKQVTTSHLALQVRDGYKIF